MVNILEKYKNAIYRDKVNWEWLHYNLSREFSGNSTKIEDAIELIKTERRKNGKFDI